MAARPLAYPPPPEELGGGRAQRCSYGDRLSRQMDTRKRSSARPLGFRASKTAQGEPLPELGQSGVRLECPSGFWGPRCNDWAHRGEKSRSCTLKLGTLRDQSVEQPFMNPVWEYVSLLGSAAPSCLVDVCSPQQRNSLHRPLPTQRQSRTSP